MSRLILHVAFTSLICSGVAHAQAWRDCVPGSMGPGGCESMGPGGGRSMGPGGGQSMGPGGGRSMGPGGGQSMGPGGGQSMGPGGGHNIPEQIVRRRFKAGLENFHERYSKVVDSWAFFDNSGPEPKLIEWGLK